MFTSHSHHGQEPRWRRLPEERPRQIIEAAFEVFGEHGLAAARLEDIAKAAGVSKGTIYLYFPNKEALFCEMIRQVVGESLTQAQARVTENANSATVQLREYMRVLWDYVRSPVFEKVYRLVQGDLQNFPGLLQFWIQEIPLRSMTAAAGIIRRGIETGEFRAVDPDAAARMLHAILHKHGIWCVQRERNLFLTQLTDDEVFQQVQEFVLHALLPNPNAPAGAAQE
ncbi:MAG: TetR/AcrR family transcriptional regulator [Gemmatimonadaceae bacterium]|nr:TetR/AcrR family transcriptional regulator [Gemmatimonadaceae bacterium]